MRSDFGPAGRAWRGEGAGGTTQVPAGGEDTFLLVIWCWLSWGGQICATSAISSRARVFRFRSGDKPLQHTHFVRLAPSDQSKNDLWWKLSPCPCAFLLLSLNTSDTWDSAGWPQSESPSSLKSDSVLSGTPIENLQCYQETRDIRHRSSTVIESGNVGG